MQTIRRNYQIELGMNIHFIIGGPPVPHMVFMQVKNVPKKICRRNPSLCAGHWMLSGGPHTQDHD